MKIDCFVYVKQLKHGNRIRRTAEWKNTNADIAYGSGFQIFGLTEGKTTITGKDTDNKYIYNLDVIKPIGLQIKKVDITKNKVKYTIKNLNKKEIKFGKKVSFVLMDASYRYYADMDKDVTIKPKETKVLTINAGKDDGNKKYTFKDKAFNKYFYDMTFDITYNGRNPQYVLLTKPVKNTAKKTPEISSFRKRKIGEKSLKQISSEQPKNKGHSKQAIFRWLKK